MKRASISLPVGTRRHARRSVVLSGALALAMLSAVPRAWASPSAVVVAQVRVQIQGPAQLTTVVSGRGLAVATDENQKVTFSPALEKKLAEYMEKLKPAKVRFWTEQMQKEVDEIVKVTGLGEDGKKALEKAAEEASEHCAPGWIDRLQQMWRMPNRMAIPEEQLMASLTQAVTQVAEVAKQDYVGDYLRPIEDEAWLQAVQRILSPEQAAAWSKVVSARDEAREKEANEILKKSADLMRQQLTGPVTAKVLELRTRLNLNPERIQALDALAEQAIKAGIEAAGKRSRRMIKFMSDEARRGNLQRGAVFFSLDTVDVPLNQAVWKDGLDKLITPEERDSLASMKEEIRARRAQVFGRVLLAELDAKLAFTSAQRDKMHALAERLAKGQPAFFPEDDRQSAYRSYSLSYFFSAVERASQEDKTEWIGILDDVQQKRWQQLSAEAAQQSQRYVERSVVPPKEDSKAGKLAEVAAPEPEETENAISDFIFEKLAERRKRLLQPITLKAEDLARVTGASPEVLTRLKTAACGSVEVMLVDWKSQMDQATRSSIGEVAPAAIRQQLATMESYYFNQRIAFEPGDLAIWEKAVQAELAPEQQAAWKKETDARNDHRDKAIASLVLLEFDGKTQLKPEQRETLEPKIAEIVRSYAPELGNYFSSNEGVNWYLQSYPKFIPLAAVPEAELKTILTKDQYDRWTGCQEYSNAKNVWESIKRQHDQRVQREKKP